MSNLHQFYYAKLLVIRANASGCKLCHRQEQQILEGGRMLVLKPGIKFKMKENYSYYGKNVWL